MTISTSAGVSVQILSISWFSKSRLLKNFEETAAMDT